MRTDDNNNPIACTTDLAKQAGLVLGVDYKIGTPFPPTYGVTSLLSTARFIGDPIAMSIRVIDAVGYYTKNGSQRWDYIAIPQFAWNALSLQVKAQIIAFHYRREGGTKLLPLFAG
jgi:hypothetical protein